MALKRIVRHTIPSKYDSAEFGTICQANYDDTAFELYIQLSHTEEAHWEPIGLLLETAFADILQDEEFINELLALAAKDDYKSFESTATILSKFSIK